MRTLFVASEIAPWIKTGGLGDVAAALPPALAAQGVDVRVLVPRYPALREAFPEAAEVARIGVSGELGGDFPGCALFEAIAPSGLIFWLLDHPPWFDRAGNPYLGPEGGDWLDNHRRFGLLSRVAAWLGSEANFLSWRPDILHCSDWQTALAPAYLNLLPGGRAKSVMTIHNLAFQGLFDRIALKELGLPESAWAPEGIEYYGLLSFLKAGLQFADRITTVSPTYAREICTDEKGMGLGGLLRHRSDRLTGILNGIDTAVWDPACDPYLATPYDADRLDAKAANKAALQVELGLERRDHLPLLAVVSRLTEQKGLDLLPEIAAALADLPVQLAVLGSGARRMEDTFRDMAEKRPGQFAVKIGFDEGLAHRIEAGADIFLMPSRFEPCGLNQMYSLRYGTPPVVRATGGLADTVIDGVNGFSFTEPTPEALIKTIRRAVAAWADKSCWRRMQEDGMSRDFGWTKPARQYADLYASLC
ncbi:MAG: glycogen synthase GlgA [Candidatus Nitricoxidivorans perseverans]|uniref:Glycogen synthase n=1 Tax=Candidatus Nitricoxidivorans perseverans TaxID=2975601 RepID=A0AA49IXC0_9PROT|nr:MAG: glycogen synthase GlgA [Candidatus Nitricoxidivorans perseverans]